jgi:hypothetical protein
VSKASTVADPSALDRKLATAAWVLFFVTWGLSQWAESNSGVSLRNQQYLCAGLILLGLNLARFLKAIPMSRLTLTVGLLAAVGGLYRLSSGDESLTPLIPIALLSGLAVEGLARWMGPSAR